LLVPFPVVYLTEDLIHGVASRQNGKGFGEFIDWLAFEEYGFEVSFIHGITESINVWVSKERVKLDFSGWSTNRNDTNKLSAID